MKNVILILISLLFIDAVIAQALVSSEVSENTKVNGTLPSQGENNCFKTIDNLSVAGGEDGFVANGESSIYVASNSIIFSPGFTAVEGSYMHAYIITDYCPELPESIVANQNTDDGDKTDHSSDFQALQEERQISIYPNPTNGKFHIDFLNNPIENAEIFLFDFKSQRIQNLNTQNRTKIDIDLSYLPKGTYLVLIKDADTLVRRKIVKL